jgi:hypothetical protein
MQHMDHMEHIDPWKTYFQDDVQNPLASTMDLIRLHMDSEIEHNVETKQLLC